MQALATNTSSRRRKAVAKPKAPAGPSEFDLHAAVVSHLAWRAKSGVFWFHPANGGGRSKAEAGRLKAMGVVPGVPDLMLLIEGRCYGLELKSSKGRLSPAQKTTIPSMERAGCTIAVANSVDAAIDTLTAWGAFKC